ncbi:hypothetical protein STEG23_022278, partial [Scotinomys teguina]
MGEERDLCTLQVRMPNHEATMGVHVEVPQKLERKPLDSPAVPFLSMYLRELCISIFQIFPRIRVYYSASDGNQ